jgi:hypothetical protein
LPFSAMPLSSLTPITPIFFGWLPLSPIFRH